MPLDPFRILGAALLATLAMTSLLIGVVIGLYGRPSRRTNAIIMAFGTGALIQALALELAFEGAERLIEEAHLSGLVSWCWVAAGFVLGGVFLYSGIQLALRLRRDRSVALDVRMTGDALYLQGTF